MASEYSEISDELRKLMKYLIFKSKIKLFDIRLPKKKVVNCTIVKIVGKKYKVTWTSTFIILNIRFVPLLLLDSIRDKVC